MMARVAVRYGTAIMVATPHRFYGGVENTPDTLRELTALVCRALKSTSFAHRFILLPGQEIPLRPETADEVLAGDVLTLGDHGKHVLVEPPFDRFPSWTADAVRNIVAAGYVPVLAHPERNAKIQEDPQRVVELVDAGAILQLTAMSIDGLNGSRAQTAADWMLDRGLAGVVASDTHSPSWRPPNLRPAYYRLADRYGLDLARRLCVETPKAIALGLETSLNRETK